MEEDNANDIIKWLFKEKTQVDCKGIVEMSGDGARKTKWEARLRGNLLALEAVDFTAEPILFVCERLEFWPSNKSQNGLSLRQNSKEFLMEFVGGDCVDKWAMQLGVCSHRVTQAEYEQALFSHYSHDSSKTGCSPPSPFSSFLLSQLAKEQTFNLFQSANIPNKKVVLKEAMYETRLSFLIPQEMIKLSLKWTSEIRDELLDKLWGIKNSTMLDTLHMFVRHLNSNIEIHTQASEFLENYLGPSFRPSVEKYRLSFLHVPTNLHVQMFYIDSKNVGNFVTSGALTAMPLRYSNGGMFNLRNKFLSNLTPQAIDQTDEGRFYRRKQTLIKLKRMIGELSRRIDIEWKINKNKGVNSADKIVVEIFAESRQIHEMLLDLINSFPNIYNLVDALSEGGLAQLQRKNADSVPRDTLSSQLDLLEAHFVSLNSKMAAAEKLDIKNEEKKQSCEENIKLSFHSTLDSLHHLALSIESAQMLSLIQCLRNKNDCQTFFHLQLRHDALLSQAITLATTSLLLLIYSSNNLINLNYSKTNVTPLLINFSFLSCYGDEHGMIEDAFDMWQLFHDVAQFRFIPTNSSIIQTCFPQIEGFRTNIKISIPLPSEKIVELPQGMSKGEWFCPKIIYWNLGVNHEASLAASSVGGGNDSLEEMINRTALKQLDEYISILLLTSSMDLNCVEAVNRLIGDLRETVSVNASKKNLTIFKLVMEITRILSGVSILSCQSGKDRTSMALTLEEGRILKETCGISNQQMMEIISCLRKEGVRRENCRKNVGKPLYKFSPFQMNFLPKEFRPPMGTFTNFVST
uniref:Uncharacterized protein n=1 Tax=Meloidogyne incognita TaxID=6306 RepID=A0A914MIQ9_MELIC